MITDFYDKIILASENLIITVQCIEKRKCKI